MLDYPILLDDEGYPYAILNNAFDVFISDQVMSDSNGSEILEFKIPFNDSKRFLLTNEDVVECNNRQFIVRVVDDDKSSDFFTSVQCEATWYELANGDPIMKCSYNTITATEMLKIILKDTGWKAGIIEPTIKRSLISDEPLTRLQAVRMLPTLFECEMYFDTKNKTVNLVEQMGRDTDVVISYEYNTDSIKRNIDSRELVTKLWLYGKDGMHIKDVNKGFDYIENYSYYDELGKKRVIKPYIINDDRFNNPNALKSYGEKYLEDNCKPKFSYEVKVYLISERVSLGDRVVVWDKDLGVKGYMRIVNRKVNVLEPENSDLQLDNTIKNFSDQMSVTNNGGTDLASSVGEALGEVSMFNLLLNSRADYGFNYWINRGFEIDNTKGSTGKASFKCVGEFGTEKSLQQVVDVSNRSSYTISAQVEVQDLQSITTSEFGYEIEIEFEDGTKETQFISLI